jgi:hypothetical protein
MMIMAIIITIIIIIIIIMYLPHISYNPVPVAARYKK